MRALQRLLFLTGCVAATFAAPAAGGRIALVLAAGGEPAGPSTMFDGRLAEVGAALAGFGERIAVCDTSHATTAKICARLATSGHAVDFTPELAQGAIDALVARLARAPAREVLVVVETHGYPFQGYYSKKNKSRTHLVVTSDRDTFDLDKLAALRDAAIAAGATFALVDNSCYGGNSLALAGPDACVVTSASRGRVAEVWVGDSPASLWKQARAGQSLEAAYLADRAPGPNTAETLPQISTPAGLRVETLLEGAVERLLLSTTDPIEIQHHPQLLADFGSGGDFGPLYVDGLRKAWADALGGVQSSPAQAKLLALVDRGEAALAALKPYWDALIAYDDQVETVNRDGLQTIYPVSQLLSAPSWLLGGTTDGVLAVQKAAGLKNTDLGRRYLSLEHTLAVGAVGLELRIGPALAGAERAAYVELYRELRTREDGGDSPCARFKF